jgi:hypothetical protein
MVVLPTPPLPDVIVMTVPLIGASPLPSYRKAQ